MTGLWIFLIWFVGLGAAGVLTVPVQSTSERVLRIGRIGFAFVIAADLFFATLIFALGRADSLRSLWWVIALACGWPLAVLTGKAVSRGFAGHRITLIAAVVTMAALYLAFPLGFDRHTGLGRFENTHHGLDFLLLLVPTLIVLASEALRGRVAADDDPSMLARLRDAPRRLVVGSAIAVLAFVWLLGANGGTVLVAAVVLAVGVPLLGWWQTRVAAERMRRDLR